MCLGIISIFSINGYVKYVGGQYLLDEKRNIEDIDAIVVLGCKVDGENLSLMLADRLYKGIEVYHEGLSDYILMSGDSEHDDYDEIGPMKDYAIENGINANHILTDPYGISTYDSLYRLKEVYHLDKVIIISQPYHLYRALYIADVLDIEAYGIGAEGEHYVGQSYRELREIIARNKDFLQCLIKPEAKYVQ